MLGLAMHDREKLIDHFAAPEFFCQDAILEMAAPGIVRVLMISAEAEGEVVKVKLLMPFAALAVCVAAATAFMTTQGVKARTDGDGGADPLQPM